MAGFVLSARRVLDARLSACQTAGMNNSNYPSISIEAALHVLAAGKVCAVPTDTVYGLAADARQPDAVQQIFELKNRDRSKPLIILCADLSMAQKYVEFTPTAHIMAALWPGPLTLVLSRKPGDQICDEVTAGQPTLGVRVPNHALMLTLLKKFGRPLAVPSANLSGQAPCLDAACVFNEFSGAVPVIDGGPCVLGVASSIVKFEGERAIMLREGSLRRQDLQQKISPEVLD